MTNGAVCPRSNPSAQPQTLIIRVIDATKSHVRIRPSHHVPLPATNYSG